MSRAQQAFRVWKLYRVSHKRLELEKTEAELKTLFKTTLGVGVHRFGSYQLNIVGTEKQLIDAEALAKHLGEGELNKFRKPSHSISVTVVKVVT